MFKRFIGGLDVKNKGETSMETGPCERREGRKKAWAEDTSDCLSQASGESLSKGHWRDESHLGQKWPNSSTPAVHSHRLGAAWRERGLREHRGGSKGCKWSLSISVLPAAGSHSRRSEPAPLQSPSQALLKRSPVEIHWSFTCKHSPSGFSNSPP